MSVVERKIKRFGYIPDLPDLRDHYLITPPVVPSQFSDLRKVFNPPCYDQGDLGSCVGHGCEFVDRFARFKKAPASWSWAGSRLYVYYNARRLEGMTREDAGAMIRDGVKGMVRWGVCPETDWEYDISQFATKPEKQSYSDGARNQVLQYQRVAADLNAIRGVLTSGWPIVFGFSVYESFMSDTVAKTGLMPMPGTTESMVGGHCVACVGHDDSKKLFTCRNSWNTTWGSNGFFFMPYDYMANENLVDDRWTVTMTE